VRKGRIVVLLLSSFLVFYSMGIVQKAASYLLHPVLIIQHKCVAPLKAFFQARKTAQELQAQVAELAAEYEQLRAQFIALQATATFEQDIAELLEFKKQYDHGIIAPVLVKHISQQQHYFLVGAGSHSGITVNMPVVYNNCLVGRVQEVFPLYSKVVLITDKSCKVAASCAKTHAHGIYEGQNSQESALLNHVSHLQTVHKGDMVLSSGEGLLFPRGFGLGTIDSCESAGLVHAITLKPLLEMSTLAYVLILPSKI
jgi:rod shape-determining protein MreC